MMFAKPHFPFPQHRAYAAGTIRPSMDTQEEQDALVRTAFDRWASRYLVVAGTMAGGSPLYRIAFGRAGTCDYNTTVSEGQGYGMLIVALMAGYAPDPQTTFDGLWEYARRHRSSIPVHGLPSHLMAGRVPPDKKGNDSAFDGDCDITYALLLADKQWGSSGAIDYRSAAKDIASDLLTQVIGPTTHLPLLGDWVDPISGTPTNDLPNIPCADEYTPRSSDFMPGHFRVFRKEFAEAAWDAVISACQAVVSQMQAMYGSGTGLVPDFMVPILPARTALKPAPPRFLEEVTDGDYAFNACRVPWRLGTDALLNGDATSLSQTRTMARWAVASAGSGGGPPDPDNITEGYRLNGTPLNPASGFAPAYAAPLAVAAMTEPPHQEWLNQLFTRIKRLDEDGNYYEDTLTLLCLLVLTGNFWAP